MSASSITALPPNLLERFEVIRRLGAGGGSSVFLVSDRSNPGLPMALKLLDPRGLEADNLLRFKNEFEVLTTLHHPNLIEAYEFIDTKGAVGYLMEYVEGKNLLEVLRIKRPNSNEIDLIFSQLLGALYELHQNGLAHRDIKLENVLVRDDGFIKLSDLGLMKQVGGGNNTETGVLLGTSQYLPPEYVKHSIYDSRSDLYAVGLMLFECLAGKRWLEGKNGADAIRYLCEINFEFPKLALAGLPHKYQRILSTALMVQPWKRFESAETMRRAVLSEQGDAESTQTIEVADHINLRAFDERRRTTELISLKERRRKLLIGLTGIGAAAAVTVAIGMISLSGSAKDSNPEQSVSIQTAIEHELDEQSPILLSEAKLPTIKKSKAPPSEKSEVPSKKVATAKK